MRIARFVFTIPLALALVACASTPSGNPATPALANAERVVSRIAHDSQVAENAPVALKQAQQTLKKARFARTRTAVEQQAYLAKRQAQIAKASAKKAIAEKAVNQALQQQHQLVARAHARHLATPVDGGTSVSSGVSAGPWKPQSAAHGALITLPLGE